MNHSAMQGIGRPQAPAVAIPSTEQECASYGECSLQMVVVICRQKNAEEAPESDRKEICRLACKLVIHRMPVA